MGNLNDRICSNNLLLGPVTPERCTPSIPISIVVSIRFSNKLWKHYSKANECERIQRFFRRSIGHIPVFHPNSVQKCEFRFSVWNAKFRNVVRFPSKTFCSVVTHKSSSVAVSYWGTWRRHHRSHRLSVRSQDACQPIDVVVGADWHCCESPVTQQWQDWIEQFLRPRQHSIGYMGDCHTTETDWTINTCLIRQL